VKCVRILASDLAARRGKHPILAITTSVAGSMNCPHTTLNGFCRDDHSRIAMIDFMAALSPVYLKADILFVVFLLPSSCFFFTCCMK